jgi:hypothetical protein
MNNMKMNSLPLVATTLMLVTSLNAASLLQSSEYNFATTEVHYDFNNANKNVREALTTDASGNGRTMAAGNNVGGKWGGSPGDIIVCDYAFSYNLINSNAMDSDNYQISIFVVPEPNWPFRHDNMFLFSYDGINLAYNIDSYTASVNYSIFASFKAGGAGVMVQKMNGTFSLWSTSYNPDGTVGTWTQQGGEVTNASMGSNFGGLHMFVQPGGAAAYWGYAGDFKVQSFSVPETSTTLLGALISLLPVLRRRK